jgi:hypothetical protein
MGFTRCDIASLQQSDPITRRYYVSYLGLMEPIDEREQQRLNTEAFASRTRNEQLPADDVIRIKPFGIREPDLEKALREFAALLDHEALPAIARVFDDAVGRFGFERFA